MASSTIRPLVFLRIIYLKLVVNEVFLWAGQILPIKQVTKDRLSEVIGDAGEVRLTKDCSWMQPMKVTLKQAMMIM